MKKFILKTSLFLLFASLFYVVVLSFWGRFLPYELKPNINYRIGGAGHTHSRLTEVKKYGEIDILLLGSSHSSRGIDTRVFSENGYRAFNLGSSAQTPTQSKLLLNRYLDRLNPKTVIYEVYPLTFSLDGVESSCDIIANDMNDFESLKMAFTTNNIKTYNTLIYGYTRNFLGLDNSFVEKKIKADDEYISGGYVEKKLKFYQPEKFDKKEISFLDYQIESFKEIVQTLKDRDVELILVFAPIPKVNYESYENISYFDSIMKNHATYYNLNETMVLNDSLHFYDSHHLNQNGVVILSNKLIELLNKQQKQN